MTMEDINDETSNRSEDEDEDMSIDYDQIMFDLNPKTKQDVLEISGLNLSSIYSHHELLVEECPSGEKPST